MSLDATARHAIEETLIRYCWAIDAGDPDGVANCFTVDAESSSPRGTLTGRDAIRADVESKKDGRSERGDVRHLVLNILVDDSGADSAKVRSNCAATAAANGAAELFATGWYDDDFARDGEQWLIKRRFTHIDGH
jgi:hypothetical protein